MTVTCRTEIMVELVFETPRYEMGQINGHYYKSSHSFGHKIKSEDTGYVNNKHNHEEKLIKR